MGRVRFLANPGRHIWVEFVVGSRPCSERFFSSKTNISKFQFDLESEGHRFVSRNRLFLVSPSSNKVDLLSGMPWGRPRQAFGRVSFVFFSFFHRILNGNTLAAQAHYPIT